MTDWVRIRAVEARLRVARGKYDYRRKRRELWSHRVHLSAELHHPEARKRAEALTRKWGRLEGEEAQVVHRLADQLHKLKPPSLIPPGEGWTVPPTAWNPYRRKIANWVARELQWAYQQGARFVVTSGLRTFAEQKVLYERYLHGGNIAAPPGQSNHEGYIWPKGAVDAVPADVLDRALRAKKDRRLLWAETHGLRDFVHFSGTGH